MSKDSARKPGCLLNSRNGRSGCVARRCTACAALRHAAVVLTAERGIEAVTADAIAQRAGIVPEAFRRHYDSAEECLAAAFDEGSRQLETTFRDALQRPGPWRDRLQAAIDATFAEFVSQPRLARFCLGEAERSGLPRLQERRLAARQRLVSILAEERGVDAEPTSRVHLEVVAGAAHQAVSTQMAGEHCDVASMRLRLEHLLSHFVPSPT